MVYHPRDGVVNPIIRQAEDNFVITQIVTNCSKDTFAWLYCLSRQFDISMIYDGNWVETRMAGHGLLNDRFDEQIKTVFQFHGCTSLSEEDPPHSHKGNLLADTYKGALQKEEYFRSLDYKLVSV